MISALTEPGRSGYVRPMEPGNDILDAIDRSDIPNRGTLKAWMMTNQAAFDMRLRTRKPDWSKFAEVFAKAGLLDARGQPPTAEATRKTWYRVKRADTLTTTAPAAHSEPRQSPAPVADPAPLTLDRSGSIADEPEDEPPPKFTFRPTKLR
jgi:hypothetical protein